MDNKQII